MPDTVDATEDSPKRKLVKGMAECAKELKASATSDQKLQTVYNTLCVVLDELNKELAKERKGKLTGYWEKFSETSEALVSSSK
ncbi:MAG: hypothetical protein LH679_05470 [Cyanobacteria bacterium CAN_BIN43]|nr:hypothetical protein [Cyanobacteria bacterium CAN_BIN43]